jgi:hypothetical protein
LESAVIASGSFWEAGFDVDAIADAVRATAIIAAPIRTFIRVSPFSVPPSIQHHARRIKIPLHDAK